MEAVFINKQEKKQFYGLWVFVQKTELRLLYFIHHKYKSLEE